MSAVRSPLTIRCYRSSSWIKKANECIEHDQLDLDAAFIFYWVAFNALYGQPTYLYRQGEWQGDKKDFEKFLGLMKKWGSPAIEKTIRNSKIKEATQAIQGDRFLCKECWARWDKKRLLTKDQRLSEECLASRREGDLNDLFYRLYLLRNQLFHGCSSDRGSKNRDSLAPAVTIMKALVPVFCEIVRYYGPRDPFLQNLPYPPSIRMG
jgi:hypothetical protein